MANKIKFNRVFTGINWEQSSAQGLSVRSITFCDKDTNSGQNLYTIHFMFTDVQFFKLRVVGVRNA
jgi:hypothetical protein